MSAAIDRIVASARAKSIVPPSIELHDDDQDGSLSIGDWKDAINVELKSIRGRIEWLATMNEQSHITNLAEALRLVVRDL